MAAVAFDTFTIAQEFERVGFPKEQVAALTKAFVSSRSDPETVSKAELREHKTEVKAETAKIESNIEKHESKVLQAIAAMEARFDAKFEAQRKDTTHAIEGLRKDMIAMETRSDAKFDVLRAEMSSIKWILGILVTGGIAAFVKSFF